MHKLFVLFIAWVEIIGGVIGVLITAYYLVRNYNNVTFVILLSISVVSYIIVLIAGYWLFRQTRRGLILSRIIQLFQIPNLISSLLIYDFIAGLDFSILAGIKGLRFTFYFGSRLDLFVLRPRVEFELGVNLIAVIFFVVLMSYRIHANAEKSEDNAPA